MSKGPLFSSYIDAVHPIIGPNYQTTEGEQTFTPSASIAHTAGTTPGGHQTSSVSLTKHTPAGSGYVPNQATASTLNGKHLIR